MNIAALRNELDRVEVRLRELERAPGSGRSVAPAIANGVALQLAGARAAKHADVHFTTSQKFVSSGARKIRGVASSMSVDRQGDIVEPSGGSWKLPVPILYAHDHKSPVGWVRALTVQGGQILVEGEFAEGIGRADEIFAMVQAGLISDFSIGFRGIEREAIATGWRWTKWELLEISVVVIGANQDAKIRRAADRNSPVKLVQPTTIRVGGKNGSVRLTTGAPKNGIPLAKVSKPIKLKEPPLAGGAVRLNEPEAKPLPTFKHDGAVRFGDDQ